MQGDMIFYGTVLENVSLFELDAPHQRVREALEMALISDVIDKLPMREHTMLSDAPMLSGGETQRLLLARALYKRPGLLLLDEASSALDDATEAALNEVLRGLGATRIMIAHREHTIAVADRVIALGYDSDLCCSTVKTTAVNGRAVHPVGVGAGGATTEGAVPQLESRTGT
jgi:ATP-binding cassette subfamily B protein RaxB